VQITDASTKSKFAGRPVFTLKLQAEPNVDTTWALRGLLKIALRRFGLRAISIDVSETSS
jgi:hypothetical protein